MRHCCCCRSKYEGLKALSCSLCGLALSHCLMRYAQFMALFESQIRAKCIENDLYLLPCSAGVAVAVAVAVAVVVAATFA